MNRSDGVTAKKNANTNATTKTDSAEREKLFKFGIVAAILVIAAVLSMFINTGHSSNFCGSQFTSQQKYACLESIAVSSDNSTACASLSGSYKDNCYAQIAAKESNIQLCGNVSNYTLKAACTMQVANSTGSYNYCMQLDQPYNDACLYSIGISRRNESACLSITNTTLSDTCSYTIYFAKATEQRNSTYCSLIGNGTYAQTEEMLNSTLSQNNGSTVGNLAIISYYYSSYLNLSMSPRDMCYYSLAYQTSSPSYCQGISNSSLKTLCQKAYTVNNTVNSTSYYENLSKLCSISGQSSCTYSTLLNAIYYKNLTACKSLNSSSSTDCFASLASYYHNSSYCGYITNSTLNSACVESVLYSNSTNSSV